MENTQLLACKRESYSVSVDRKSNACRTTDYFQCRSCVKRFGPRRLGFIYHHHSDQGNRSFAQDIRLHLASCLYCRLLRRSRSRLRLRSCQYPIPFELLRQAKSLAFDGNHCGSWYVSVSDDALLVLRGQHEGVGTCDLLHDRFYHFHDCLGHGSNNTHDAHSTNRSKGE